MPQVTATTLNAKEVWRSPDGQRTIYEVLMGHEGKNFTAKTYSKVIATKDWSGTIETYDKSGKNGTETFIKQAAKEGMEAARSAPKDEAAIRAMWAIGQAITLFTSGKDDTLIDVESNAKDFFAMVDRVKTGTDTVYTPTDEELNRSADAQSIKEIFGV